MLKHLVVNSLKNFLVGCSESNHGEVAGKTEINYERTRLRVEATKEHNVLEGLLLFEMISVEDKLVINNLSDEANR